MNPDDLAQILDELGSRLGPTGEYVFALAVRQVYINGIAWAVCGAVLIALGAWTWRRVPSMDHYDAPIARFIAAGLLFFGVFIQMFNLTDVLNPEYAAIRNILGSVAR